VRYYKYKRDWSVAGLVIRRLMGDKLGEIYHSKKPVASRWKPVRALVLDDERKQACDFPPFYDYPRMPVFSQRAWDVLSARIACRWEALPIIHPSKKPFYLIHVMEVIDCLDHRDCLKPELLVGKHIFRTTMVGGSYLFVDDVFRKVVEEHKLKGLEFRAIPRVDAGG
jgi:hypothetical protein